PAEDAVQVGPDRVRSAGLHRVADLAAREHLLAGRRVGGERARRQHRDKQRDKNGGPDHAARAGNRWLAVPTNDRKPGAGRTNLPRPLRPGAVAADRSEGAGYRFHCRLARLSPCSRASAVSRPISLLKLLLSPLAVSSW